MFPLYCLVQYFHNFKIYTILLKWFTLDGHLICGLLRQSVLVYKAFLRDRKNYLHYVLLILCVADSVFMLYKSRVSRRYRGLYSWIPTRNFLSNSKESLTKQHVLRLSWLRYPPLKYSILYWQSYFLLWKREKSRPSSVKFCWLTICYCNVSKFVIIELSHS